jgi:RNA polymerase sigma factor (sigma-70 family)
MNSVTQYLRALGRAPSTVDVSDGELLERFVAHREEAAFEELLRRHGPMVLRVCQSLLPNPHDADDAFQATFLVLVRRASALEKRLCLANWLYAVAQRSALNARRAAARRGARERRAGALLKSACQEPATTERELQGVVGEEINRLPEKYRAPIVLCYLEGKTNEEAARRLGCPKGTILSRLARARDKLRGRLIRRGVTLSAAGLCAALAENVAAAAPSVALLAASKKNAALLAAGKTVAAGALSPGVAALTKGVLKAMFVTRLKNTAVMMLVLAVAGTGLGLLGYRLWAAEPVRDPAAAAPPELRLLAEQAKKEAEAPPQEPEADAAALRLLAEQAAKAAEQAQAEAKGSTEPAGVPLEARLIAKKDTYVLDLGGKTPQEFRKLFKDSFPPTPVVDLELEFRNSGVKNLTLLVGGFNPDIPLLLKLDGPGAVNLVLPAIAVDVPSTLPEQVTLGPGQVHTLPIKGLMTDHLDREGSASYWLQTGDYILIATYKTAVSPVPVGAKDNGKGFGPVTVISAPVKLKVVPK